MSERPKLQGYAFVVPDHLELVPMTPEELADWRAQTKRQLADIREEHEQAEIARIIAEFGEDE